MTENRTDTCPTCGAAVRVVSGDEGTSSYQPVAEADNAALMELLRREVMPCLLRRPLVVREISGQLAVLGPYHDVVVLKVQETLSTPHPGQPLLDRLARLEAVVAAVKGSHYCARVPAVAVALAALKEGRPS